MAIDHVAVLAEESARAQAALAAAPGAVIPWSDDWTVAACAQHLGGFHRWVDRIVRERPAEGWTIRGEIESPEPDSPELAAWTAAGATSVVDALRSADPGDACWSWWDERQDVGFWARRAVHETLVHRWDLELGAGIAGPPMDPAVAADGIDEFLEVFVGISRFMQAAPGAGESFHVHCTDTDGEWLLVCAAPGERELRREHAKGDVAYRGRAEDLLLFLWGRHDAEAGGVEVLGDPTVHGRWAELVPSM